MSKNVIVSCDPFLLDTCHPFFLGNFRKFKRNYILLASNTKTCLIQQTVKDQ